MPRVDYSRGAGRRVPGVYAAMLEKEREQRVVWADPDDHSAGVFRRDDKLLKLLEAGKPVIVQRWWVGSRKSKLSVHWPYERGTVKFVQVNPDDTITPARDLDPHVGRVAEGY
jgi:hypothetical protein